MLISGAISIRTDLQYGKVKNTVILISFLVAALINGFYYLFFARDFCLNWIVNVLVTSFFSILLYAGRIWGAGDAKLFILMFLCVPGRFLDGFTLSYGIMPYLFVFSISAIWLVFDTIKEQAKIPHHHFTKNNFSITDFYSIGIVIVETLALSFLFSCLFPAFVENNSLFCSFVIISYSYYISYQSWSKNRWVIIGHIVIVVICLTIRGMNYYPISLWFYPAVILITLFTRYASRYNYEVISTSTVVPGMILSAATVICFQASKIRGLPTKTSEDMSARISDSEAEAVRRWEHSAKGSSTVTIVRKIPFASMIPIGFLLWIISRTVR